MRFKGHGLIWDPKHNKVLARFPNGRNQEVEVEDPKDCKRLMELGYKPVDTGFIDAEYIDLDEEVDFTKMKKAQLVEYAKEHFDDLPSGYERMKNEDLIELILERS